LQEQTQQVLLIDQLFLEFEVVAVGSVGFHFFSSSFVSYLFCHFVELLIFSIQLLALQIERFGRF